MPDTATAPLATTSARTADQATGDAPAGGTTGTATDAALVDDDTIVEEISIDGMCGVY